jgi:cell division protein FtsX
VRPGAIRLVLFGRAAAYGRLLGIVAGVAIGMAFLLILLGAYVHMPERDTRAAWLSTPEPAPGAMAPSDVAPTSDGVDLWRYGYDYRASTPIEVVWVASTPTSTVALPGGVRPPRPGEYYASPALARLIASLPADQLGDRYGTMVGELPQAALRGPSQMAALVGADWQASASRIDVVAISTVPVDAPQSSSAGYQTILAIGSIALLVPVVLLISIVAQLGAVERRERFATVRLIGAGRRAIATLSALEMGLVSLVGALVGVGLAAALRPVAGLIPINGTTSFGSDLTPSLRATGFAIVLVTVLGAVTARRRAYRDDVGAPGATRERPEKRATARRAVPLVAGLVILGLSTLALARDWNGTNLLTLVLLAGFALVAFGLVFAGPWITAAGSRAYARHARTATGVVAAGRLSRHPRATFRSVAGLVVAVYLVSIFSGLSSVVSRIASPREAAGMLSPSTLVAPVASSADASALSAELGGVAGVKRVVVARAVPEAYQFAVAMTPAEATAIGAINVPSSPAVGVDLDGMMGRAFGGTPGGPPTPMPLAGLSGLNPLYVIVVTDGTTAAVDRAWTALERQPEVTSVPMTRVALGDANALGLTNELGIMAYSGLAVAVAVSALALTVATIAAALDRKRTFGLLRLSGMPVARLRRIIASEAVFPIALTVVASAGLGFLVAWLLIAALGNDISMGWPDWRFAAAMATSLAIGAVAIMGSFGIVRRSTEVVSTRFE